VQVQPVTAQSSESAVLARLTRMAVRSRYDMPCFFGFVMREETAHRLVRCAPHERLFFDFTEAHPRCVVRMPRNSSKTFCFTTRILHQLGNDPGARHAIISEAEEQAKKPLGLVREYIERDGPVHAVFPHLRKSQEQKDPWTQTQITVDRPPGIRDPSLVAAGIGGKALQGSRLKHVNVDDLLSPQSAHTREKCEATNKWFGGLLSTLDPHDSSVCVTNTPVSPYDLTYWLESSGWATLTMDIEGNVWIRNTDWDSDLLRPSDVRPQQFPTVESGFGNSQGPFRFAAHDAPEYLEPAYEYLGRRAPDAHRDVEEVVPLWPERFDRKWIEKAMRDPATLLTWPSNYMCLCRDDARARCKIEWVEKCKENARDAGHYLMPHTIEESALRGLPCFTGVDLGFGEKATSALTTIITICILPNYKRLVVEVDSGHYQGAETIDHVFDTHRRYNSIVRVETNGAQKTLRQWARERNVGVPIRSHNTGKNKVDPRYGIEVMFVEMDQGAWLFPNNPRTHLCESKLEQLLQECKDYDPAQHTGDHLIGLWLAHEQARQSGALVAQGGLPSLGLAVR
jgi:hypothetical protein